MKNLTGFTTSETFTSIPDSFFRHLLPEIEDVAELKVTLYLLWRVEHMEGTLQALPEGAFASDELGLEPDAVRSGLEKAVERATILRSQHEAEVAFFPNTPQGQAAAEAFARGGWRDSAGVASSPPLERPNIYKMYEENIGPLVPIIADALKDAEETYSAEWVAEAIELAAKHNARNWKYSEAILKRWKEEGRGEKQDRRNSEEDRGKYLKGEYSDFIEH